ALPLSVRSHTEIATCRPAMPVPNEICCVKSVPVAKFNDGTKVLPSGPVSTLGVHVIVPPLFCQGASGLPTESVRRGRRFHKRIFGVHKLYDELSFDLYRLSVL